MVESTYISRLRDRLRKAPDSRLYLSLAEELRKHDRLEESISVLLDGIKNSPDFAFARLTLGRLYISGDMLAEAKEEFLNAIRIDPDNFHAHKWLAETCRKSGDDAGAIQEYKKVLEIVPFEKGAVSALEEMGVDISEEEDSAVFPVHETMEEVQEPLSHVTDMQYVEIEEEEPGTATAARELSETGPVPVEAFPVEREGKDGDVIVKQLNEFLLAVKARFADGEESAVMQRLNLLLEKIQSHFSEYPAKGYPANRA